MSKVLSHFSITEGSDGYILHLEDEDGDELEMVASFEQLDLIVEAINERLDSDEEDALEVDGEDQADED